MQLIKLGDKYFSLAKAAGKKDITKLVKKIITNKKGNQQTVYVAPEDTGGWLNNFMSFFHFKEKNQAETRINQDYEKNHIKELGLDISGWKAHVAEYFLHRDKWKKFFSRDKKETTGGGSKGASGGGKKETTGGGQKKPSNSKFKLSIMKLINDIYGKSPKVEEPEKPKDKTETTGGNTTPSADDKLARWKSGDLTGVIGEIFTVRNHMTDGKTMKPVYIKNKVIIKEIKDDKWLNYEPAGYEGPKWENPGGGMSKRAFIEGLTSGNYTWHNPADEKTEPAESTKPKETGQEEAAKKEMEEEAKKEAREGYFNEKPAEVLNVGADVWGASRHKFDTYEKIDANINQMETDGSAAVYATKKNLIGEYGMQNKAERMAKGETEQKVLASFLMRDLLSKTPADNKESRAKYIEFCRAVQRVDQETTDAKTFIHGMGEVFANMFPVPDGYKESPNSHIASTSEAVKEGTIGKKAIDTLGDVLTAALWRINGENIMADSVYYVLSNKERRKKTSDKELLDDIIDSETTPNSYNAPATILVRYMGKMKAAGLKIKKGDNVVFTDNLKDRVYYSHGYYPTDQDKKEYIKLQGQQNVLNTDFSLIRYGSHNLESKLATVNEKYSTNFSTKEEAVEWYQKEYDFLDKKMDKHYIVEKLYPSEKGQVVQVKKDSVLVSFNFTGKDGVKRNDYFRLNPDQVKAESVESVKRSIGSTSTFRLDLLMEDKVERKGGKDYEKISIPDAQKILAEEMKFKAVQYGNSMPDAERQYHTKWTVQAMSDLSEVLGLPLEQITAKGKLGIAFGARGRGGKAQAAIAHYESASKMINLTRASGFGSLAHEWGHFLDNVLGGGTGKWGSTDQVMEEKTFAPGDKIPHGAIYERKGKRYFYDSTRTSYNWAQLKSGQDEPDEKSSHYGFGGWSGVRASVPKVDIIKNKAYEIAQLSKESLTNQTKAKMEKLDDAGKRTYQEGMLDSAYYNKRNECFARAFESYIADKLEDNGRKNTYLSSKAKTTGHDGTIIYPQAEYRTKINKMFDEFFEELRKTDELKKAIEIFFSKHDKQVIRTWDPRAKQFTYRMIKHG